MLSARAKPSSAAGSGHTADRTPLVVEFEETLTRTEPVLERLLSAFRKAPLEVMLVVLLAMRGRISLRSYLADNDRLDVTSLPVHMPVMDRIEQARAEGRPVFLASATDRRFVEKFAAAQDLFDGVITAEAPRSLQGAARARALVDTFGTGGFDYIGSGAGDLPVWGQARRALVSDPAPDLLDKLHVVSADVETIRIEQRRALALAGALRPHQWLKNLLILVPALAAHSLTAGTAWAVLLAFLSFSLCASSAYVLNDLLDLEGDRNHPRKCLRPFASGALPLRLGMALVPALLIAALLLALMLPWSYLAALAAYLALTLAYSLILKRKVMVDVVALAMLYGVRLLAGGAAAGVVLSEWLVVFSVFLFLSLALVKRSTELVSRLGQGLVALPGRGYLCQDLPVVEAMAAASGFLSVLVFAFYINSPDVRNLYPTPLMLWGVCLLLVYWIGRILVLVRRGEMHDDPVVFAVTDRTSLVSGALAAALVLAAAF